MKRFTLKLTLVFILLSTACIIVLSFNLKPKPSKSSKTALTVGSFNFTHHDLLISDQIQKLKHPYAKVLLGEKALRKAYLYRILLAELDHNVTTNILENELTRINKTTLDPQKWAKYKDLFEGHHQKLLRLLILPIYVESTLPFKVFPRSTKIHAPLHSEVTEFYNKAILKPHKLENLAIDSNKKLINLCVWLDNSTGEYKEGKKCQENKKESKNNSFIGQRIMDSTIPLKKKVIKKLSNKTNYSLGKIWMKKVAKNINEGEVFPQIIETSTNFIVIRLNSKTFINNELIKSNFSYISFKKKEFGHWVNERSKALGLL